MTDQERVLLYQRVFENSDAKMLLEDLKARFHLYSPIEGPNSEAIVFKGGQQSVVMHINNMINPFPQEINNGQHNID